MNKNELQKKLIDALNQTHPNPTKAYIFLYNNLQDEEDKKRVKAIYKRLNYIDLRIPKNDE